MKQKNKKKNKKLKIKRNDELPEDLVKVFKKYDNQKVKRLFYEILKSIER